MKKEFFLTILIVILSFYLLFNSLLFFRKINQPLFHLPRVYYLKEPTISPAPVTKELQMGKVGELEVETPSGEKVPLITPEIPGQIFSTSGEVLEIGENYLIILSDGQSFADRKQRKIKCLFDEATLSFSKDHTQRFYGKAGLSILRKGIKVLVSSRENIRGKIEFVASTVNILE